jgi:hypothetical protein
MIFAVYGGFELPKSFCKHVQIDKKDKKSFWDGVERTQTNLSAACGCYIFAMQFVGNIEAWYVGKTEKQTFKNECFELQKKVIYNDIMQNHAGTGLIYLIPKLTNAEKFSKPRQNGHYDIEFLETMLIGIALKRNSELANNKKTKLLKEMVVPGVLNTPPGGPALPVRDLKNALGLPHS